MKHSIQNSHIIPNRNQSYRSKNDHRNISQDLTFAMNPRKQPIKNHRFQCLYSTKQFGLSPVKTGNHIPLLIFWEMGCVKCYRIIKKCCTVVCKFKRIKYFVLREKRWGDYEDCKNRDCDSFHLFVSPTLYPPRRAANLVMLLLF